MLQKLTLNAMFEKCAINGNEKKSFSEVDFDRFRQTIAEQLESLKSKLQPEDFENLTNGKFYITEVYRKAIPKDSLLSSIGGENSEDGN